ncbi:uncharacterized protein LOC133196925 [Saccostrea echinata]|uniref:uncharacterized protein LOC133196925 n=1 Tax=Saccostrea echinata TaxID=191078 RepID=UPI002A8398AA|nr:uncharacterized protein LOC133196925 [Saccostrea echinata]
MSWLIIFFAIKFIEFADCSPPSQPQNVHVVNRDNSFIVTWEVPSQTYGNITNYVLLATILPEESHTTYRSNIPMAIIDASLQAGRMFLITVTAENKNGLSKPSRPFYIRKPCGRKITMVPGSRKTISSPGFPSLVKRGVHCQWDIKTEETHILHFHFLQIDLGENNNSTKHPPCTDAFISVGDSLHKICRNSSDLNGSSMETVLFSSGMKRINITGFQILVTAKVKAPGPPVNITMTSSKTGVFIKWLPPVGHYIPLTSYTLKYRLTNYQREIVLSPRTTWFSIDTRNFKGQLLMISVFANISKTKGEESKELYFRASCHRKVKLSKSEVEIVSPGYPDFYPPGLSCSWEIVNPKTENMTIIIVDMDIENSLSCSSDYLAVSLGESYRKCGVTDRPMKVTTRNNYVNIRFVSDFKNQGHGFRIKVKKTQAVIAETSTTKYDFTSTQEKSYSTKPMVTNTESTEGSTKTASITILPTRELTAIAVKSTQNLNSNIFSERTEFSITTEKQDQSHLTQNASLNTNLLTNEILTEFSSTKSSTSLPQTRKYTSYKDRPSMLRPSSLSSSFLSSSSSTPPTTTKTPSTLEPLFKSTMTLRRNLISTILPSTFNIPTSSVLSTELSKSSSSRRFEQTHNVTTDASIHSSNHRNEINKSSIENILHNISVNLEFMNRKRNIRNSIPSSMLSSLHDKLYTIFNNPSGILVDLELRVTRTEFNSIHVLVTLMYSVPKLLKKMKTDIKFHLIRHINETVSTDLLKDCITFGYWKLDCKKLSKFCAKKTFYNQEITSPCALVVGYCSNNSVCTIDRSAELGIICLKTNLTVQTLTNSTIHRNQEMTFVIVGGSIAAAVIFLLLLIIIIYRKCSKRNVPVTHHQPFNDILLNSRYIGDKNVEFTAFTTNDLQKYTKKRKTILSFSFPTKSIKSNDKNGDIIEYKLKQLTFIEDQKELKKRLELKYRSRRTNSV